MNIANISRTIDDASLRTTLFATLLSLFVTVSLAATFRGATVGSWLMSAITPLWAAGAIVLCAWLSSSQRKPTTPRLRWSATVSRMRAICLGLTIGVLHVASILSLLWLVNGTPWSSAEPTNTPRAFGAMYTTLARSLHLADVSLLACLLVTVKAVAEEVIFRYLIFRKLMQRCSLFASIAVSSALFALMHFRSGWTIAAAFISGVSFAAIYRLTGRLSAPIVAHIALNASILLFARASGGAMGSVPSAVQTSAVSHFILFLPPLALCATMTYVIVTVCKNERARKVEPA